MRFAFCSLALTALLLSPVGAHASYLTTASEAANEAGVTTTLNVNTLIGNVISVVLGFMGVLFLVLTIYAGLMWMTAGGNTDNVKKAKNILVNSVIGLIIVLSSYAIAATVLRYLESSAY